MLDSNNFLSIMLPAAGSRDTSACSSVNEEQKAQYHFHAIIGSNHARDIADVFHRNAAKRACKSDQLICIHLSLLYNINFMTQSCKQNTLQSMQPPSETNDL